jgi:rhodanese-related sulfurtransferase
MNDLDYAGDLSPQKAWEMLKSSKDCSLLDCRTIAEWQFVGIPDLSEINKKALFVEWQTFPIMQKNENFLHEIVSSGVEKENKLIIICRSGARSRSAGRVLDNTRL